MGLSKDAEWKSQFDDGAAWIPNIVDVIHIFIAKTQFYQVWKPTFLRAEEYPDMWDWLNEEEDCLATEDWWELRGNRPVVQRKHKKLRQAREDSDEEASE